VTNTQREQSVREKAPPSALIALDGRSGYYVFGSYESVLARLSAEGEDPVEFIEVHSQHKIAIYRKHVAAVFDG